MRRGNSGTVGTVKARTAVSAATRALNWSFSAPRPPRELRGRILKVRPETVDSATLVIKPGTRFRFDHQPGQYIGIGLLVDGRWRWRSYSLTSAPRSLGDRTLTITVKAMPEGFLSSHLVAGALPGTVVRLAAPQGEFVLPDPAPVSVLFLTAGSGITPVMSMLRTMRRRGQIAGDGSGGGTHIRHLHSVPAASDVMFGDELRALAGSHSGYRLTVRTTRTAGRLALTRLAEEVPDWRDRQTWACGPSDMLAEAETVWAAAGIADRLHVERFAAVRAAVPAVGGAVTFARSGRTVKADAATSVLEAGEQAGVRMPFGCRMGICHTCVVNLVDGRVVDLRNGNEHEPGSRVQICVTAPSGDCVVDI